MERGRSGAEREGREEGGRVSHDSRRSSAAVVSSSRLDERKGGRRLEGAGREGVVLVGGRSLVGEGIESAAFLVGEIGVTRQAGGLKGDTEEGLRDVGGFREEVDVRVSRCRGVLRSGATGVGALGIGEVDAIEERLRGDRGGSLVVVVVEVKLVFVRVFGAGTVVVSD